jgi:pantetheine-phosphate adenylyltransferase
MKKALYAGTFDPFTNGHLDIAKRAIQLFDELTIVVAVNSAKEPFLDLETRKNLLKEVFKDEPSVKVDSWEGLIVDYAKNHKIQTIVRGLRPIGDFESEFQMATMNEKLNPEVETVFLMTGKNLYYISSSLVKEVYTHGRSLEEFIPKAFNDHLEKMRKK